ncbi:MAG TPA: DNA alkylation repair protein [Terriglobales bacterium]|nr:DNA alkylation repair protein [Terriglobales bacterium]
MPAIDLARLRKQANRLNDFFFVPDEFIKHLMEMLDFYVNYTVRKPPAVAPGANLQTYRTPAVIVKQIEQELVEAASSAENADAALDLADRLWDEPYLELHLLAAFLLGCIPPHEEHLLARLTAWTQQVHDPALRSELLNTGLRRIRQEAPEKFLELISEWLQPQRTALWPNGIQAVIAAISDPNFVNLPPLLKVIEPIVETAPSKLQLEIEELVLTLYATSPTETSYFLRQVFLNSQNPMTAITFRRIAPSLPDELREEVREFIRGKPFSQI